MPRIAVVWAAALAYLPMPVAAQAEGPSDRGQLIAEQTCAPCHAVGRDGDSPRAGAPRFRELGRRYPVESLEEALAEGILVGHSEMPQFEMSPADIRAFIDYLQSIQTR